MSSSTSHHSNIDLNLSSSSTVTQSPHALQQLTLPLPANTFGDDNLFPYSDDLLTPPLTNPSLDESPFRPGVSDRTSLSMKSRHLSTRRSRRKGNRACASSGDVEETAIFGQNWTRNARALSRSWSTPNLTRYFRSALQRSNFHSKNVRNLAKHPTQEGQSDPRRDSLPQHPRRWTMPGKAAATQVLTSMSPIAVITESIASRSLDENAAQHVAVPVDTPAMITLQRAASAKSRRTSLRPGAYTSFPTPTFSKEKSGFVTSFFGEAWHQPDNGLVRARLESVSMISQMHSSLSKSIRASVDHGNVQPSQGLAADPVCTNVVIDPIIQSSVEEAQPSVRARRCSTRYVSGSSVCEVIWDENISTSSSANSRRTSIERPARGETSRRSSLAVEKLEKQLFKSMHQSRKNSSASQPLCASPDAATGRLTIRRTFQNTLRFQPTITNAGEESGPSIGKLDDLGEGVLIETVTGDKSSTGQIGIFPPFNLAERSGTNLDSSDDALLINPWRTSWDTRNSSQTTLPNKKTDSWITSPPRRGSMIGTSTGVRRKSMGKSMAKAESKLDRYRRRRAQRGRKDGERSPLLGRFNAWQEQPYPTDYSSIESDAS